MARNEIYYLYNYAVCLVNTAYQTATISGRLSAYTGPLRSRNGLRHDQHNIRKVDDSCMYATHIQWFRLLPFEDCHILLPFNMDDKSNDAGLNLPNKNTRTT